MYRKRSIAAITLMALCAVLSFRISRAAVGLLSFEAEAQVPNKILLTWKTATEADTAGFRLYRSQTASPANWGDPITTVGAAGDAVTGSTYSYEDTVTPGVIYYYSLKELSNGVESEVGTASAKVDVTPNTPTATTTALPTFTATWTRPASSGGSNVTPTPTTPPPTATRRYTNTPVVSPLGTPTPQAATQAPFRTPTPTPLPPARVATPTGLALVVTLPPALTPAARQGATPSPTQIVTATAKGNVTGTEVGPVETATPLPTKDVTPIIFAAETTPGSGSPTPENAEQVAGQGSRTGSLALMLGGSALGLTGLLVAGFLFLRSRKP